MARNLFNSIKVSAPQKNVFDLSHDVKFSCDMGKLIPIYVQECVPGDKFKIGTEALVRFAPLVSPVMHRINVYMHYFFVPNRILWKNWEKWITSGDTLERPVHPYMTIPAGGTNKPPVGGVLDYMGYPAQQELANSMNVNPLPLAAYMRIYFDYYRDQNMNPSDQFKGELIDGDNTYPSGEMIVTSTPYRRAWMHDYFTSALPWAQKGAAVEIPGSNVVLKDETPWSAGKFQSVSGLEVNVGNVVTDSSGEIVVGGSDPGVYDPNGSLRIESTTINEFRRALALQKWLELNARAGTRYVENIYAHFGVKSSDARLQRAEYITGSKSTVVISEVLNNTGSFDPSDDAPTSRPQGDMAGHGISVTTGKQGSYFCEEHGYIIGIMSVMPVTAYMQGVPKFFTKIHDPYEIFWPSFQNIGEQPIEKDEIYAVGGSAGKETFGYTPRYGDYRYSPSRVAGQFRTTLEHWHLARKFSNAPSLNQTFMNCDPGKRIFAVTDPLEHSLYCHVLNRITAIRPMSKFGTPTL